MKSFLQSLAMPLQVRTRAVITITAKPLAWDNRRNSGKPP